MARGIERRHIFADDADRAGFLLRLAGILRATGTPCFAYAEMPNHFHLVLETASTPLSLVMRRLGTSYAMEFNRRHERVGYLFQNRFKSRLVADTADFLGVVRYVHLNPVRAGIVATVADLASYPWTGHAALMGRRRAPFLDASYVLRHFADDVSAARIELARWMQAGVTHEEPAPELEGVPGSHRAAPAETRPRLDLEEPTEQEIERGRLRDAGWDLEEVLLAVCGHLGVDPNLLRDGRRTAPVSLAREGVAGLAVGTLAETREAVARATGVTRQAATQALDRFAAWPPDRREELRALLALHPVRG